MLRSAIVQLWSDFEERLDQQAPHPQLTSTLVPFSEMTEGSWSLYYNCIEHIHESLSTMTTETLGTLDERFSETKRMLVKLQECIAGGESIEAVLYTEVAQAISRLCVSWQELLNNLENRTDPAEVANGAPSGSQVDEHTAGGESTKEAAKRKTRTKVNNYCDFDNESKESDIDLDEDDEIYDPEKEPDAVHEYGTVMRKHVTTQQRRQFTDAEKQAVLDGVAECGFGKWTAIRKQKIDVLESRTPTQLRDCMRTMMNHRAENPSRKRKSVAKQQKYKSMRSFI
jgi:hypothetical protein